MAVYLTILFYSIPKVTAAAPDMKLFDVSPSGYTSEYAESFLTAIGADGRNLYLFLQLPLDFIYPGLFILFYSALFAWTLKKIFAPESKIYYALYLPVFAGLFDYAENILVILMIKAYPKISPNLVAAASFTTVAKSVLSSVFFVTLILSMIYALWKFIFNKQRK